MNKSTLVIQRSWFSETTKKTLKIYQQIDKPEKKNWEFRDESVYVILSGGFALLSWVLFARQT